MTKNIHEPETNGKTAEKGEPALDVNNNIITGLRALIIMYAPFLHCLLSALSILFFRSFCPQHNGLFHLQHILCLSTSTYFMIFLFYKLIYCFVSPWQIAHVCSRSVCVVCVALRVWCVVVRNNYWKKSEIKIWKWYQELMANSRLYRQLIFLLLLNYQIIFSNRCCRDNRESITIGKNWTLVASSLRHTLRLVGIRMNQKLL